MSSSSNRRSSAIDRSLYPGMRATSPAQRAQLALDLGVHVERLLALAHPALVARDHELADLLAQLVVDAGRLLREGCQLGLDVERRLPARLATGRLGLEHLADLLAGLGAVWRRGGRLALHDQVAVPDAPVDPPAAPVGDGGQQHRDHGDDDDDRAELHAGHSLTPCGESFAAAPWLRAGRPCIRTRSDWSFSRFWRWPWASTRPCDGCCKLH